MREHRIQFARELRSRQTDAEGKLWHLLRRRNLAGAKFRRQHSIGPYIVDFACTAMRVAIELDGGQHVQQLEYDDRRTAFLRARGWRVLRFWDDQVLVETDAVLERVLEALGEFDPSP